MGAHESQMLLQFMVAYYISQHRQYMYAEIQRSVSK